MYNGLQIVNTYTPTRINCTNLHDPFSRQYVGDILPIHTVGHDIRTKWTSKSDIVTHGAISNEDRSDDMHCFVIEL